MKVRKTQHSLSGVAGARKSQPRFVPSKFFGAEKLRPSNRWEITETVDLAIQNRGIVLGIDKTIFAACIV